MGSEVLVTLLDRYGIGVALLVAIVWGARNFAAWLGSKVVEPLAQKHVEFLDSTQACMAKQAEAAVSTAHTLDAIQKSREDDSRKLADIHTVVVKNITYVDPRGIPTTTTSVTGIQSK